jgi:hypothetical protein
MRAALAGLLIAALASPALAGDDDFANTAVVFVRGNALMRSDAKGRNETELATLPARGGGVRALHTDAIGKILVADIGGTWSWMPLDGSTKTLTDLPCEAGPAQLSDDGRYVFCRKGTGSLVVNLVTGKLTPLPVPTLGARMLGNTGNTRKLVWADKGAVWAAVAPRLANPTQVAPQAPLRGLSPSPDGTHALGVYAGDVFEGVRKKVPGETLMAFSLDGQGAQRKVIQNGVPVDWSRDSKWALVQDGAKACIMLVAGGQYKCWRGYTAVSIAPDGRYALVLGNRSSDSDKKADKKSKKKSKKKADEPAPDDGETGEAAEGDAGGDAPLPTDDVAVPPPDGPRSLYRVQLEGAYTKSPALVARVVEGAAVWIPTGP